MLTPEAPNGLSKKSRDLWTTITSEYGIQDAAGLAILGAGLQALDRQKEAEALLKKQGITTLDRFGQVRMHPGVIIERDARAAFLAALRQLNLDFEIDTKGPGRPAKG